MPSLRGGPCLASLAWSHGGLARLRQGWTRWRIDMDTLWFNIVQWLHTLGLHVDGGTARAVGDAAATATAQLDMPSLLALAAVAVFAVAGPWMLSTLVDFIRRTIEGIPGAVG